MLLTPFTQQPLQLKNSIPSCAPEFVLSMLRFSTPDEKIGFVGHHA